jgi:hypothetical protein
LRLKAPPFIDIRLSITVELAQVLFSPAVIEQISAVILAYLNTLEEYLP